MTDQKKAAEIAARMAQMPVFLEHAGASLGMSHEGIMMALGTESNRKILFERHAELCLELIEAHVGAVREGFEK